MLTRGGLAGILLAAGVDLQIEAREIAFDVAAAALVGLETGADADRLRELFNSLLEGLRSLHILDGFVRETGRLYSPVLNVPRRVLQEFEFGGYVIPKRVPVRLAIAAGHRLPAVFRVPETGIAPLGVDW